MSNKNNIINKLNKILDENKNKAYKKINNKNNNNKNNNNKNNNTKNNIKKLHSGDIVIENRRKKRIYDYLMLSFYKKEAHITYNRTKYFSFFINKYLNYEIDYSFPIYKIKLNKELSTIFEHNMKLTILKNIYEIILKFFLFSYLKSRQHSLIFFLKTIITISLIFIPPTTLLGVSLLTFGGFNMLNVIMNSISATGLLGMTALNYYEFKHIAEIVNNIKEKKHLLNKILFDTDEDGHIPGAYSTSYKDSTFKSCRKYLVKLFKDNIFIYRDPYIIEGGQYFAVKVDLDSFRRIEEDDNFNIFFNVKAYPIKEKDLSSITFKWFHYKYFKMTKRRELNYKYNNIKNNNEFLLKFHDENNEIKLLQSNNNKNLNKNIKNLNNFNYKYLDYENFFSEEIPISQRNSEIWKSFLQIKNKSNNKQQNILNDYLLESKNKKQTNINNMKNKNNINKKNKKNSNKKNINLINNTNSINKNKVNENELKKEIEQIEKVNNNLLKNKLNKVVPNIDNKKLILILENFDKKYLSTEVFTNQKVVPRTLYNRAKHYLFSKKY